MADSDIYLEIGTKRTFAAATAWPGWARHGPDADAAIAALLEYGPRYARVLKGTRLRFAAPASAGELTVVERLAGNATTDFGAPGIPPSADRERLIGAGELRRFEAILHAGWRAFDAAAEAARGRTLAAGPRGGGRSLDRIVAHVLEADAGYLRAAGWKAPAGQGRAADRLDATRAAIVDAVRAAAAGGIPERGPRGGVRWTGRYFVRRVAWHVIAHAWEIERRAGLWNG